MNRVVLLTVLIVAVAAVFIVVGVAGRDTGPPDAVRSIAQSYASVLSSKSDHYYAVKKLARAADPDDFYPPMSQATYGDSLFFRTTYPLHGISAPGGRGVAYPPQDAWCASLAADGESGATVVVIARHQDLYNSDWIVHTLADPLAATGAIRCKVAETYD